MLLHVPGATSYQHLRTVDRIVHPTYKSACLALNLLVDDHIWDRILEEAILFQMPSQLRQLFVIILIQNAITDPKSLFEKFMLDLAEDFIPLYRDLGSAINLCLGELERLFNSLGTSCSKFNLPVMPNVRGGLNDGSRMTTVQNANFALQNIPLLNFKQRLIFNTIKDLIANLDNNPNYDNCFFIDGPASTGKTFLLSVSY